MKTAKQLRDELAQKREALTGMTATATTETRELTEAENITFDATMAEITTLEGQLRRAEQNEIQTRAALNVNVGETGNRDNSAGDVRDLQEFNLMRGLQLMAQGKPLDGVEAEVHSIAQRDAAASNITLDGFGVPAFLPASPQQRAGQTVTLQTANPGDQGGVTVPTQVNALIKALWARTFLGKVGARRLAGLQGNQSFPVQTTKPTIQSVGEIQQLADDGILFSSLLMSPSRRGTSIPVSKQLLLQSSIDVNALILDNINMGLDVQMNIDAINELLLNITAANGNLLDLGANGRVPTYADIVGLESLIAGVDADTNKMAYLTNAKMRGALKLIPQLANTAGIPIWKDGEMNGYPAVSSNIVPGSLVKGTSNNASAIIFGNFDDLYVGMWGGVDYVIDPYALKKNAEIEITANMWWNVKCARPASFAGIKAALPA